MQTPLVRRLGLLTLTAGLIVACSQGSKGSGGNDPSSQPQPVVVPAELDGYVQKLVERCETIQDDTSSEATLR
jgi:hypothetical protein